MTQRNGKNTPIQGTSADILKRALKLLKEELSETNAKIVNIIHDEIVVEADADEAQAVAEKVERVMCAAGQEYLKTVPVKVETEIADQGEMVVWINGHPVGVGTALTIGARAFAHVLDEVAGQPQVSVGRDGQDRDAATVVVGHQQVAPGRVEQQVTGPGAARGLLVDQGQLARWANGKRADRPAWLLLKCGDFIHRVQVRCSRGQR